jgi:hypothetical protein
MRRAEHVTRKGEVHATSCSENIKGRDKLRDLDIDGRILEKYGVRVW